MKSPIPAIPTKTLNIEGRDYTVYKLVKLTTCGQHLRLTANFRGQSRYRDLWKCSHIPDLTLREAEIHLRVQDCIEYLHSKIEQEYLGDRFRYAKSEPQYSLSVSNGALNVNYHHYNESGESRTQVQKRA